MDLRHPLTDRHEICTHVWCGVTSENLLSKFFTPTLRKFGAGKTSKFAQLPLTRRQSEARNFEMAQRIDKQKRDVSSTINALKRYQTWGIIPRSSLQPREKNGKLKMIRKMCISFNTAKFSAGRPLFPVYNFAASLATAYSTYRFGLVAS